VGFNVRYFSPLKHSVHDNLVQWYNNVTIFLTHEFKGKSEDKLQNVNNVLNKNLKIYDLEIAIFKNKSKGFLCEDI